MTNTETKNPFRGRGFIAAAIVVGVIVLAAIVVLVSSLTGRGDDPVATPSDSPTAIPTSSAADESICGLEGFETEDTLSGAPKNEWELVGTVAAPTEPDETGPGVTENGFRSCYSHTAQGALYATVNWFALSSDARNIPKLPELVEPGPGRDAAIAAAGSATATPSETRLQVAGFKINSYDGQEAVVDVAWSVTSEGGALVSLPTVLHWVDGDWKIVLTDAGTFPYASAPLENLGGYTPWAGV